MSGTQRVGKKNITSETRRAVSEVGCQEPFIHPQDGDTPDQASTTNQST